MPGTPRIRSVPRAVAVSVLAVLIVSGGVAFAAGRVGSTPTLPAVSTDQLIASVIRTASEPPPVSGIVVAHVDLGLPSLPASNGSPGGLAAALDSLTGDHRIRVWASKDGYRASELLPTSERSIFVNRSDAWLWDSDAYTAYHLAEASGASAPAQPPSDAARLIQLADPLSLARQALLAASPSTRVSLGTPQRVAGRPAYVLVLTPRDSGTLVGRVEIAVDAARRVPLQAAVFARSAGAPALSAGFVSVSFAPVDPSVYRFVPPPGATVKDVYEDGARASDRSNGRAMTAQLASSVRTFGAGWSTVVAVKIPPVPASAGGAVDGVDLRGFLPYSGPLFSVRLVERADHAWLIAGAVPQAALARVEPSLS